MKYYTYVLYSDSFDRFMLDHVQILKSGLRSIIMEAQPQRDLIGHGG